MTFPNVPNFLNCPLMNVIPQIQTDNKSSNPQNSFLGVNANNMGNALFLQEYMIKNNLLNSFAQPLNDANFQFNGQMPNDFNKNPPEVENNPTAINSNSALNLEGSNAITEQDSMKKTSTTPQEKGNTANKKEPTSNTKDPRVKNNK